MLKWILLKFEEVFIFTSTAYLVCPFSTMSNNTPVPVQVYRLASVLFGKYENLGLRAIR